MRTLVLISVLLLGALPISAGDTSHGPIPAFASCPDTLTANCGDTITYQFQIINAKSGQPHPDARYFIPKGSAGHIDSLTGKYSLWSYRREYNLNSLIKVGAYFTTSKKPDTAFCRFVAIVCPGQPPQILGDCPITSPSFRRGTYTQIQLEADTYCGAPFWSVIQPTDSNVHATISSSGLLFLQGRSVGDHTAWVVVSDPCGADTCEVKFTINDEYPYDVRIAKKRMVLQGGYENVAVTIDSVFPALGLGGFDLLITFDHTAISLQSVTEGDIYEKCGWEYFTYRYGADSNCPTCPPGLVRVIGIAETNNGDDHPFCKYPESLPATLFTMKFLVSNDRSLFCQYIPIRFFWRDCGDNRLMCDSGNCNYFLAGRVFDYDSLGNLYQIDPRAGAFPGTNGLPDFACRPLELDRPFPYRFVDFYHGGMLIAGDCPIDIRGDLNLNDQAFEIADAVLFQRYFIYGPVVFTINPPAQIIMSDVNFDNIPLTVEDFCYMYQVIIGNELPYDRIPPLDTATFELSQGELALTSPDTLGALLLTVSGQVDPTLTILNMGMQYNFDGANTHILISPVLNFGYPLSDSAYILPGTILTGLEGHEILSIETANYRGGKLVAHVNQEGRVPYAIRISKAFFARQGESADIDVILDRSDQEMGLGGFNLLLTYDTRHLTVSEVTRGSIFDSCAWEYFTYRFGNDGACPSGCPTGLLRVVGIAETNNGETHPVTNCSMDGLNLFSIRFLITNYGNLNCAFLPVRPFWIECGDNALSDESGQVLLLANNVYRYCDSLPYPPQAAVFPGFAGLPDGACPGRPSNEPLRWVDFYPGGIDIACEDSVDGRGDVNINGQPFEIADELLFARYLVFGDSVLTISKRGQLVTTDINFDSELGTIEDYVLLHRRVHDLGPRCWAEELEIAGMIPDTAFFSLAHDTLFVETDDTLGAVLLSVVGNIWPRDPVLGMTVKYNFDGAVTRILIAPDIESPSPNAYILSGPVFRGLNQGQILSIESATWRGAKITSHFSDDLPDMAITIGRVEVPYLAPTVTVPVKLQHLADHISLGGFDLLITFEDSALSVEDVTPGPLHEPDGWEYFNWRLENAELCQADCPGGLLRVVGLAETSAGLSSAASTADRAGQTLFDIKFRTGDWRLYECLDIPISFYWTDCADNQCITSAGEPLRERFVYSHTYPWMTDTHYPENSATFPGIKGVPVGACDHSPFAGIDFYSGSVHFYCGPELDPIGDLNLNELAYEIADERLFAAFFLRGLSAFTINQLGQTAASDINRDGTPLTVEDYVLIHRIINGWAFPYDNPPDDPDTVRFLHAFGPLYAATDDTLGAVAIVVEGNITPRSLLPNMTMEYAFDGVNTHIFIHPPHGSTDSTAYILAGPIVDLQNALTILSVSVSTHRGAYIAGRVDIVSDVDDTDPDLPGSFVLHQNYPNPFNAGTVVSFDLPRSSEVKLEIINVLGNVVYRRAGAYSAGTHKIDWNGTTTGGQPVASGIYYYRLTAGGKVASRKMLLLK